VNGLSVDIAGRHIYWTDGQRQRIEMSDYDGHNRRVVIHVDLLTPRAVLIDAVDGYQSCFASRRNTITHSTRRHR